MSSGIEKNDVDVILGQSIAKILKIESIEAVAVRKKLEFYIITVYLTDHDGYNRILVTKDELEMANFDMGEYLALEFRKRIDAYMKTKGEKHEPDPTSN